MLRGYIKYGIFTYMAWHYSKKLFAPAHHHDDHGHHGGHGDHGQADHGHGNQGHADHGHANKDHSHNSHWIK